MPSIHEGPATDRFQPVSLPGGIALKALAEAPASEIMRANAPHAPSGSCTFWGIPFDVKRPLLIADEPVQVKVDRFRAQWLVFMHTSDVIPLDKNQYGFFSPHHGVGRLGEHAATYVVQYADGTEEQVAIRRRRHIGMVQRGWGENCFECVSHRSPCPVHTVTEQPEIAARIQWGHSQFRVQVPDMGPWVNWLWAWENPHPRKMIAGFRFEPVSGRVLISAVSGGKASSHPLRWGTRRKAIVKLPRGAAFEPDLDAYGRLKQIQIDMGHVIAAQPRTIYPDSAWENTYNNKLPEIAPNEVLVEYTAHPDARFHVCGRAFPVGRLEEKGKGKAGLLVSLSPATQRVRLRVVQKGSTRPVPVKLHVHGRGGEYLAPVDRHRIPNPFWFEDYSPDFVNQGTHCCTYIPGECTIDLPLGTIYVEISRGFEIRPIRKAITVSPATKELEFVVEKVLPWRERGWVTADTHVHFLSPPTARLEGAAEGVNVINLLASQWGELMTNVGDFDGETTFGSKEAGGDGEYLVRVGTENRQHVLGHISLLGYQGPIIAPMTAGGPDESALGDPVDILLTQWARQCRRQGGLVVLPHFPNPRAEHAAAIIEGDVDAIEMTSWGDLYGGIDPYSLSDWYRYLNCGYFVPAVGGTDKMSATTAVGAVRTYARLPGGREFTYRSWMQAIRSGDTFATYGPLLDLNVDGKRPGAWIEMGPDGGSVDVTWHTASVTIPMSRVELVVNGEIRESSAVHGETTSGSWRVRIERSCWLALLVRGHYPDKPEIIAAHSSPVMVRVEGSPFYAAADAVTVLDQIEGAIAYLNTVGTRADTQAYKRMRLVLTSAHRRLHNQLHLEGHDHTHTPVNDHPEHHG